MEERIWTVLTILFGGGLALVGGWLERRWADRRRWVNDSKQACVQLLTLPLLLMWDANMILERRRNPTDRDLPSLHEMEERMRAVMMGIGQSFSEVSALGSSGLVQGGSNVLDASMRMLEAATSVSEATPLEHARVTLSEARLSFLEVIRSEFKIEGLSGLPIDEEAA